MIRLPGRLAMRSAGLAVRDMYGDDPESIRIAFMIFIVCMSLFTAAVTLCAVLAWYFGSIILGVIMMLLAFISVCAIVRGIQDYKISIKEATEMKRARERDE